MVRGQFWKLNGALGLRKGPKPSTAPKIVKKVKSNRWLEAIETEKPAVHAPVHKVLPTPRPVGGDPDVWNRLIKSTKIRHRRGTPVQASYIHIYGALNDSHWLTAREVATKLTIDTNRAAGQLHQLREYGYLEVKRIKKESGFGKINVYRRHIPNKSTTVNVVDKPQSVPQSSPQVEPKKHTIRIIQTMADLKAVEAENKGVKVG